jgi:hypothetical protein
MSEPQQLAELYAALAKAQAEFPPIERTRTVEVRSDKGNYSFDYAPLDVVIEATRPALTKHGLAVMQPLDTLEGGALAIRTKLTHASGAELEFVTPLQRTDKIQQLGSLITYMRRYAYQAIVGVATDSDDDGNAADDQPRTVTNRAPQQRPQAERPKAPPASQHPPKLLASLLQQLTDLEAAIAKCNKHEEALTLRGVLGGKGKGSELTAAIAKGHESGELNDNHHASLKKTWKRCDDQLAKKLTELAPDAADSFSDNPDDDGREVA